MSDKEAAPAKPTTLTPDLCVIGAGSGGIALATAAAAFGIQVVLIEHARMGGRRRDATKTALRMAAAQMQAGRGTAGITLPSPDGAASFTRIQERVMRLSTALATNDSAERMAALGITVIRDRAHFTSRSTVTAGARAIKARRFVIATGTHPVMPPVEGLDGKSVLTADAFLELPRRPERLVILGAGPDGVETAQAMARLGSAVTLVDAGDLLAGEDREAAGLVRRALLRDGVTLHEQSEARRAEAIRGGVRLFISRSGGDEIAVEGTHLMVAAGHAPDIAALDLDIAGVSHDARGVLVDSGLRTQNRRVFAIGGCAALRSGSPLAAGSVHQAGRVLRNVLFRLPVKLDAPLLPRLIACDPEIASVGLSESQARAAGAVTILRWPYAESVRARAEGHDEGFVKVVADRKGRILGASIVGAQAGELIAPWCLAIARKMRLEDMAGLALPEMALSEISARVAGSSYAPLAARPGIRRLIGFLRRFG